MPAPGQITKATLQEIRWDKAGSPELKDADGKVTEAMAVQFNPQTLKVNYANQKAGGDQPKGSAVQFVGKGTTKLTCELIFDVTVLETGKGTPAVKDVRALTARVNRFMEPKPVKGKGKEPNFVPPGVRFAWGTFEFDGVMDSVDETLDFFSEEGTPLRATVAISISKQEIKFDPKRAMQSSPFQTPAGITPLKTAGSGDTVAKLAGPDYKSVAAANGIENPRMLAPGALLDLSGGVGLSASLGLSGGMEASIGASFGISAGTGASFSAGASAGLGGGAGISAGAGAGFGASADTSAGLGADAGLSAEASAGAEASFR